MARGWIITDDGGRERGAGGFGHGVSDSGAPGVFFADSADDDAAGEAIVELAKAGVAVGGLLFAVARWAVGKARE